MCRAKNPNSLNYKTKMIYIFFITNKTTLKSFTLVGVRIFFIHVFADFEDMSCEMIFGEEPPDQSLDPAFTHPCYKQCNICVCVFVL